MAQTAETAPETFLDELKRHASDLDWPRLHNFLNRDETQIFFQRFQTADQEAQTLRRTHRWITGWSAGLGTVALVLAIAQLSYQELADSGWAWRVEGVSAVSALLLVVVGVVSHVHKRWLQTRLQAERLRLKVFELVTNRGFWNGSVPKNDDWKHWITSTRDVETGEHQNPDDWKEGGTFPAATNPSANPAADAPEAVARFYLRARLRNQINYFENKMQTEHRRLIDDPTLIQTIFFTSVVLALGHVLVRWLGGHQRERDFLEAVSKCFLFLSAFVPIAFTGFRTWASSNEFARNASRAKAKQSILLKVQAALDDSKDQWTLFTNMRLSEAMLEEEQREWLRLMSEAIWVG